MIRTLGAKTRTIGLYLHHHHHRRRRRHRRRHHLKVGALGPKIST